jgi:hypothetical protein
MKNAVKFEYRTSQEYLAGGAVGLIMVAACTYSTLTRRNDPAALVTVGLVVTAALYAVLLQVRIWLSEGAVYLGSTYISAPPPSSLFGDNKNVRIPYATINAVTSTNDRHVFAVFGHEYLHIHYDNKETTIDSAMFESKALYEEFKSKVYSRLNIKQSALSKQSARVPEDRASLRL